MFDVAAVMRTLHACNGGIMPELLKSREELSSECYNCNEGALLLLLLVLVHGLIIMAQVVHTGTCIALG